ncbi:hypothetical protein ACO2Q0_12020 [Phenylobacterium sp. VNQ135]|uniref:hypothetical protein n=1 Tax=Phenylobacterium sp. VNQ135 TaxID=3400922 RepID=UPI003C0903FA
MIRILTLAAVAALVAAPASAQSMRVATAGKSSEQVQKDILKAAKTVCSRATVGSSFQREMMAGCVKATLEHVAAQSGDPALAALPTRIAAR